MVRTRFALILYFRMVAYKAACHTLSRVCFEINEDMVQIVLMLKALFTQESKVEDQFCGASSGSEPSLFFSNSFFSLGFRPIQDDFQHDFARVTDEADSSGVLADVQVALFKNLLLCQNLKKNLCYRHLLILNLDDNISHESHLSEMPYFDVFSLLQLRNRTARSRGIKKMEIVNAIVGVKR